MFQNDRIISIYRDSVRNEASEETNARIDEAVRNLVQQAFDRAKGILQDCASIHEEAAQSLLEKETLGEEDLGQIRSAVRAVRNMHQAAQ